MQALKNAVKYILQKTLGYQRYLFVFSKYKINNLKSDKKEGDFFAFMNAISGEEGVIMDVGANIGIMTAHLSRKFPKAEIHCIEPVPTNLSVLNKIIAHFKLRNTKVFNVAVGEREEELEMVLPVHKKVKMQGLAHVVHDSIDEWNDGEKFKVKSTTIDQLEEGKTVLGIKMDIENFEYFALKGATKILTNQSPVIYLELWENENRDQCFDFLEGLGYQAFVVENDGLIPEKEASVKKQNFIFKKSKI